MPTWIGLWRWTQRSYSSVHPLSTVVIAQSEALVYNFLHPCSLVNTRFSSQFLWHFLFSFNSWLLFVVRCTDRPGEAVGCFRYSADLFGPPSGGPGAPVVFPLPRPADGNGSLVCTTQCFERGFPFSAWRHRGVPDHSALCLCGHDIDTGYHSNNCFGANSSFVSIYLHKPGN